MKKRIPRTTVHKWFPQHYNGAERFQHNCANDVRYSYYGKYKKVNCKQPAVYCNRHGVTYYINHNGQTRFSHKQKLSPAGVKRVMIRGFKYATPKNDLLVRLFDYYYPEYNFRDRGLEACQNFRIRGKTRQEKIFNLYADYLRIFLHATKYVAEKVGNVILSEKDIRDALYSSTIEVEHDTGMQFWSSREINYMFNGTVSENVLYNTNNL